MWASDDARVTDIHLINLSHNRKYESLKTVKRSQCSCRTKSTMHFVGLENLKKEVRERQTCPEQLYFIYT